MNLITSFSHLLHLLLLTTTLTHAEDFSNTLHLRYNTPPFKSNTLQGLGEIFYTVHDNGTVSSTLTKWTPPAADAADVRIGFTSFSSASGFLRNPVSVDTGLLVSGQAVVQLLLDAEFKDAIAVGLGKGGSAGEDGKPEVRVFGAAVAPSPVVNKPVVVSAEGKVQEAPVEKTFLQKYWWVLLAVTFLLMSSGGGGGDGK